MFEEICIVARIRLWVTIGIADVILHGWHCCCTGTATAAALQVGSCDVIKWCRTSAGECCAE